jgi:hypothetical protein
MIRYNSNQTEGAVLYPHNIRPAYVRLQRIKKKVKPILKNQQIKQTLSG